MKLRYDGYTCRLEPIHIHQRVDGLLQADGFTHEFFWRQFAGGELPQYNG
ncbi:hypothetical protein [Pseudomonas fluorescens]|nr:hypothetical protein [Pseudomonas fluorescens]